MKTKTIATLILTVSAVHAAAEHHQTTAADHRSAAWQIEAYSTAAPEFIGRSATIIGISGNVLREGSNGWTCQSANPRPVPEAGWSSAHEAMAGLSRWRGHEMDGRLYGGRKASNDPGYLHVDAARRHGRGQHPSPPCSTRQMRHPGNGSSQAPTSC